jgi:hypothetical protein
MKVINNELKHVKNESGYVKTENLTIYRDKKAMLKQGRANTTVHQKCIALSLRTSKLQRKTTHRIMIQC